MVESLLTLVIRYVYLIASSDDSTDVPKQILTDKLTTWKEHAKNAPGWADLK